MYLFLEYTTNLAQGSGSREGRKIMANVFHLLEGFFPISSCLLAMLLIYLASKHVKAHRKNTKRPPEPSGSWPLIGHFHLLSGSGQLLHRTLGGIADMLGPVFCVRLGTRRALVVSSWEVAKECYTTNDRVFPERPRVLAAEIMGYGHKMFGFAPYGPYWRECRKMAVVELLSNHRLELLKHVRDTEVKSLVKELYQEAAKTGGEVKVEMKEKFGDLAMNIIVRTVAGKRYFGSDADGDKHELRQCQKATADFFRLVGIVLASDTIPCLGWLDWIRGYVTEMKQTARELDAVLGSWVKAHREKRANGSINANEQDFIHVMFSVMDDGETSPDEVDVVIKATCLSIILGGADTTVATLTWALSLLMNNPNSLKGASDELDAHVGKHRQVEESDIKNLVYLQAIVKETLRLYPVVPLSARIALEDCNVAGFHVSAGTLLQVNVWKLHRDPRVWSNPMEFRPERFLDEHVDLDVWGQDSKYVPFSSGRRMCPGVSFGLQVVQLTLARLLHGFEPGLVSNCKVDMTESPGMTMPKATPLEVILRPRLPPSLYEIE